MRWLFILETKRGMIAQHEGKIILKDAIHLLSAFMADFGTSFLMWWENDVGVMWVMNDAFRLVGALSTHTRRII